MIYYLIVCRSLTYAQRTAAVLERAGITARILRAPKSIAGEGCSYASLCQSITECPPLLYNIYTVVSGRVALGERPFPAPPQGPYRKRKKRC